MATKEEMDRLAQRILEQDAENRALNAGRSRIAAAAAKKQITEKRAADEREARGRANAALSVPEYNGTWSAADEEKFQFDFAAREREGDRLWAALSPEAKAKKKRMAGIACGFAV